MAGDDNSSGSKAKEQIPDYNSPYYLHPSDYPRQMHVNDALNDNNYLDWILERENFLFAKNKIGFVDGTVKKPEKTDANYMAWLRCDAMIKGWLTTAMEKQIRVSVKYANTAEENWTDLRERFGKESAPRAYELKQLLSTTKQDGTSVSAYYTRLRSLWDEIGSAFSIPKCSCAGCGCGISKKMAEIRDKERLYEFLLGLNIDYSTIRTRILAMKPIPSLGEAYHLVAEDEQQRAVSSGKKTNIEAAAFQAYMKREGISGQHKIRSKSGKRITNDTVKHCDFCGKDGHNRNGCFKRIRYPEWWPEKGKIDKGRAKAACVETNPTTSTQHKNKKNPAVDLSNEHYQQFLKFFNMKNTSKDESTQPMANMAGRFGKGNEWVVDSGCTEHITHDSNLFHEGIGSSRELPVTIPNGDSIGKGPCKLSNGTKINDVLYVPDFTFNLLSVSRLTKNFQFSITFFPDFFVMQDLNSRKLIGTGECRQGLYRMEDGRNNRMAMATTSEV